MIEIISIALLGLGLLFFLGTSVGLLALPDFYTRSHAAAKGDTLSSALILLALAIYNLNSFSVAALLISLKILFIIAFMFITTPTASHALIDAGYEAGIDPWSNKKRKRNSKES